MDYDIIICGAGLSGRLLAYYLVKSGKQQKILLIDKQLNQPELLLGFWESGPGDFDFLLEDTANALVIRDNTAETIQQLRRNTYKYFYKSKLFAFIDEQIRDSVELVEDKVVSIIETGGQVSVNCQQQTYSAKKVYTSLAVPPNPKHSVFSNLQYYLGYEIETETTFEHPVFMDFSVSTKGQFRFGYLLPLTNNRLFIHLVDYFGMPTKTELEAYISKLLKGTPFTRIRTESGKSPLYYRWGPFQKSEIEQIGTLGGFVNPATGYAFRNFVKYAKSTGGNKPSRIYLKKVFFYPLFICMTLLINLRPEWAKSLFYRVNRIKDYDNVLDFVDSRSIPAIFRVLFGILF